MGGEGIRVSVMRFGMMVSIVETLWMGGEGTLIMMIGSGFSVVNFATGGSFSVVTSFDSSASGSQKNESSETCFGRK